MNDQLSRQTSLADFQPLQKIGEGSFSTVYKVKRNTDSKIYALKKVRLQKLSQKQVKNSLNEVRILASIESPFIIHYNQAFFDEKANSLCVVMEYANQGDLQKAISTRCSQQDPCLFEQREIWKAAAHILSGLQLLHVKGILHRDLKTANIFITEGIYKIGDMNVSKVQSQQQQLAYTQTGTPYYASPQIWRDQPYDDKSDIWSFGCILYEMCNFHPPFQGKDIESLYKSIKRGKYQKIPEVYSEQLSEFIASCLNRIAKERPTAEELIKNKSSVINRKCKQFNIFLKRDSSFNLLKTINYKSNQKNIAQNLPTPRYELSLRLKNRTEQTLEKSPEQKLSPVGFTLEAANQQTDKKLTKIQKIQRLQQKVTSKLKRMLKYSQDRNISETDRKSCSKIKSMKNILDLHQIRRSPKNNRSQRQMQSIIDVTHIYPRITRNRNLTTERREVTQIDGQQPKELDVIKEIRKRREEKNKQKKANSSAMLNKIQRITKKRSSLNIKKEDEFRSELMKNQQKLAGPLKEREEQAFVNHLRKMSKKDHPKNYNSIPTLNRLTNALRIETDFNKIQPVFQENVQSKRVYFLKKKSKNQQRAH